MHADVLMQTIQRRKTLILKLIDEPMSMPNNEAESKSFTMLIPKLGLKMVV